MRRLGLSTPASFYLRLNFHYLYKIYKPARENPPVISNDELPSLKKQHFTPKSLSIFIKNRFTLFGDSLPHVLSGYKYYKPIHLSSHATFILSNVLHILSTTRLNDLRRNDEVFCIFLNRCWYIFVKRNRYLILTEKKKKKN